MLMFYRARSYAPYLARRRRAVSPDVDTLAHCRCRAGDRICPRHAPNLYTLGGASHRARVAT